MKVKVLEEHGHAAALLGMGLSHGVTSGVDGLLIPHKIEERLWARAKSLAHMQGGHNKYLESVIVWLDITAPRYWWQQADTYRMATKQSESTMHRKSNYTHNISEFEIDENIPRHVKNALCNIIDFINNNPEYVQVLRPESFLQRRIVCCSYKTLQNMYHQRHNHKLPQWHTFCDAILKQLQCPQWIKKEAENG